MAAAAQISLPSVSILGPAFTAGSTLWGVFKMGLNIGTESELSFFDGARLLRELLWMPVTMASRPIPNSRPATEHDAALRCRCRWRPGHVRDRHQRAAGSTPTRADVRAAVFLRRAPERAVNRQLGARREVFPLSATAA
jgi:hypothetical protein